jgi:proline racemase
MDLTTALIEIGMVPAVAPETSLRFDTPVGRVEARATLEGERVGAVTLTNGPAFVLERDVAISLAGVGEVPVDVVFGGNVFALVPASALGVKVAPCFPSWRRRVAWWCQRGRCRWERRLAPPCGTPWKASRH